MPSNRRHTAGRFGATKDVRASATRIEHGIAEYLEYHERIRSSPKTTYNYRLYLQGSENPARRARAWTPFLPWTQQAGLHSLTDLDQRVIDRYFDEQSASMTRAVHITCARYLRRWLRWLVDQGMAERVPATVTPPKEPRARIQVFTKDEMIALRNVVQKENIRDWAIFLLLADTGIRASELCDLRVQHVNWKRRELRIHGKGNKWRDVPFTASFQAMMRYREVRGDSTEPDYFFLAFYGTPVISGGNGRKNTARRITGKLPLANQGLRANGLYQLVSKWGRLADVTEARCSPHTFRHYFAVNFLRGGGNVMELQRILGHTDLSMTRRYVDLAQVDLQNAHRKYSPALELVPGRYQRFEKEQEGI